MRIESLSFHLLLWTALLFGIAYAVNRWTRYQVNGIGWLLVALVSALLVYLSPIFLGAIYA